MPVAAGTTSGFPTYTITVNDTKPIWAYCQQKGPPVHCASGMVFSANAPLEGNTFDAFKAAAIATGGGASSAAGSSSSYSASTSTAPPTVVTVTETVTEANSVYTTTYASSESAAPSTSPSTSFYRSVLLMRLQTPLPLFTKLLLAELLVSSLPLPLSSPSSETSFSSNSRSKTTRLHSPFSTHPAKRQVSRGKDLTLDCECHEQCDKTPDENALLINPESMPVGANATTFPTFNITVNTTAPIW